VPYNEDQKKYVRKLPANYYKKHKRVSEKFLNSTSAQNRPFSAING